MDEIRNILEDQMFDNVFGGIDEGIPTFMREMVKDLVHRDLRETLEVEGQDQSGIARVCEAISEMAWFCFNRVNMLLTENKAIIRQAVEQTIQELPDLFETAKKELMTMRNPPG